MNRDGVVAVVLIAGLCLVLPVLSTGRYVIDQATVAIIWATVAVNWNLIFSMAGVFSLAQLGFFAVGGYTLAVLNAHWGVDPWIALPIAGIMSMLAGMLTGIGCLRLHGAYVALLTLALSQAAYLLIITDTGCFRQINENCIPLTGGSRGLSRYADFGFRDMLPFQLVHVGDYGLAALILILSLLTCVVVSRTPLGLGFRSIRDNEQYARARGVNKFRFQLAAFAISAFFTGVAGAIYAGHFRVMGPNVLRLDVLLFVFAMIVVGGGRFLWGPVLGALLVTLARESSAAVVGWQPTIVGCMMLLMVLLAPQGLSGLMASSPGRCYDERDATVSR